MLINQQDQRIPRRTCSKNVRYDERCRQNRQICEQGYLFPNDERGHWFCHGWGLVLPWMGTGQKSGILALMGGVGAAGDIAVQWGQSLLKRGDLLRGGAAYLGGKVLSKAYLGFVIADLVFGLGIFS
uniref:Uncharacterized protein n=1 Tax=Romanomermis culicivorax TaxID=13658 RepID=A0A915HZV5_ROMCU